MSHAILCTIAAGALPALKAHRLDHLRYIRAHRDLIRFGGPTRGPDGLPRMMIIVLATDDRSVAEGFIAAEPYNASGAVFSAVEVLPWSQVMPEASPGALDADIAAEEARRG